MSLLLAATVVLAAVSVVNLLLISAIIRKLRDREPAEQDRDALPVIGAEVGQFMVAADDGETITDSTVAGHALVAFVSPNCPPCQRLAGELAKRATELPDPTIAFVIDDGDQERLRRYADSLAPAVRVAVVESQGGPAEAFGFGGATPTLIRVRDGVVAAAGHDLDSVLAGALPMADQVR
jgi:hypothetical protein